LLFDKLKRLQPRMQFIFTETNALFPGPKKIAPYPVQYIRI